MYVFKDRSSFSDFKPEPTPSPFQMNRTQLLKETLLGSGILPGTTELMKVDFAVMLSGSGACVLMNAHTGL